MQSSDALVRAAHELRLLGLPIDLVDDLIALAARRLGEPSLAEGTGADGADDDTPPDAGVRALVTAARGILCLRRDGCFQPLPHLTLRRDLDPQGTPLPAHPRVLTVDHLVGPPDHVDLLRRAVTELAVHQPDLLAGALTAITLAHEVDTDQATVDAGDVIRDAAARVRRAPSAATRGSRPPDPAAIEALLLLAVDCRFERTVAPTVPPIQASHPTPDLTHRTSTLDHPDSAHG